MQTSGSSTTIQEVCGLHVWKLPEGVDYFNSLDNRLEIGCNNSCTGLVNSFASRLAEKKLVIFSQILDDKLECDVHAVWYIRATL